MAGDIELLEWPKLCNEREPVDRHGPQRVQSLLAVLSTGMAIHPETEHARGSEGTIPMHENDSGELAPRRNRFFDLSVELLGIADLEGRILQANPSWERVLGYPARELYQTPVFELIHPEDIGSFRERLRQLREKDTTASTEGRLLCKDGTYRWMEWKAASVVADGVIYLFARDITVQKHAEQQVQRLNVALVNRAAELESANADLKREMSVRHQAETALKETNAELEAFAYSVSHDLRAPLRSMQGFAQALVEDCADGLGPAGRDYARRIVSAGARLDALIQDLLLYSRVSHRSLDLSRVNMADVVHEALGQLDAPLTDACATVTCEEPFYPVLGHHVTLVQVVCNLVANAIKFVAPGVQPRVRIKMEALGHTARLWIRDNGIGVPPEFQTRIFRVFERLHGMDAYPGTGVGLAIVRKGIERMGGHVGVDSIPEEGSTFWFELPRALDLPA